MSDDGSRRGQLLGGLLVFAGIFVLVGLDLLGDYEGGIPALHLAAELGVMALSASGILYLVLRLREARAEVATLSRDVAAARAEAARWRAEAGDLLAGLSAAMQRQFDRWGLTAAERDVTMGLLEGRSHKEIARDRRTSERTVRQQARSVYQKAGLAGRSELAGFFLGGLLERSRPGG